MATVANSADCILIHQRAELLQLRKLSLDSKPNALEIPEPNKKATGNQYGPVDSGNALNGQIPLGYCCFDIILEEEDEDGEEEEKETVEVVDEKEIVVVEEPAVRVQKRTVLRAGKLCKNWGSTRVKKTWSSLASQPFCEQVQKEKRFKSCRKALQKLGFYSGEEDMEFSSFSSGTERAVKTWQSSLGVVGDGIMTSELL
ncbi:protein disulfide isomerase pTAC5, chloroplastic [Trifolium repens]|nr:protein disulfide isomerase pTAC5, chloroplastic [Trifolium repens]